MELVQWQLGIEGRTLMVQALAENDFSHS